MKPINQQTLTPTNPLGADINPTVVTWSWESRIVNCYGMLTDETKTYYSEFTVTNSLDLRCIIEVLNSPNTGTTCVSVVEVEA
jgi:hypothetical protein